MSANKKNSTRATVEMVATQEAVDPARVSAQLEGKPVVSKMWRIVPWLVFLFFGALALVAIVALFTAPVLALLLVLIVIYSYSDEIFRR